MRPPAPRELGEGRFRFLPSIILANLGTETFDLATAVGSGARRRMPIRLISQK